LNKKYKLEFGKHPIFGERSTC